jgi:hypothetical protein
MIQHIFVRKNIAAALQRSYHISGPGDQNCTYINHPKYNTALQYKICSYVCIFSLKVYLGSFAGKCWSGSENSSVWLVTPLHERCYALVHVQMWAILELRRQGQTPWHPPNHTRLELSRARILKHLVKAEKPTFQGKLSFQRSECTVQQGSQWLQLFYLLWKLFSVNR